MESNTTTCESRDILNSSQVWRTSVRERTVQKRIRSFDFEDTDRVVLGDIRGTRKRCLGMIPELLTDARETSYWIYGSLLTADGFYGSAVRYTMRSCMACE